jgi:branched-chain amino acid transport system substrate-binding protein
MSPHHNLAAACIAVSLVPLAAAAENTIKIGFPLPLSGPASVYGVPIIKGAEMAVQEINAKGGVLGRKLELLERDSKANADEAVRLARELIIKDNVDFLIGTGTSNEAPAVSTVAKENKIVFIAPTPRTMRLTSPENLHPYIFRVGSTPTSTDAPVPRSSRGGRKSSASPPLRRTMLMGVTPWRLSSTI